jgi:CHASE2 domain-containing sensor protein
MAQTAKGGDMTKVALGLSLTLGLGVAMLLAGLFYFRSGGEMTWEPAFPMIIMVVIAVLLVVLVVAKSQSR